MFCLTYMRLFLKSKFHIMKKIFTVGICFLFISQGISQFYYNDIIGTQQTNQQYKSLITHQLKKVSAISYEGNNQPAQDFVLDQTIDLNKQQVVTRSKSSTNGEAFFISTYLRNRLTKTVDSSSSAINTVEYQYDLDGKIRSIHSVNKDFDGTLRSNELHSWFYNTSGLPEKMLRIKNNTDTTFVAFSYEGNNVAEETWRRNNKVTETYYYYYNPKNQLTDVVRYNRKAKQMLPDFILEYDEKGRVVQMTQTQSASANYLIWRYVYNTKGLKEKEMVYNKQKEFLGKIEYNYQ